MEDLLSDQMVSSIPLALGRIIAEAIIGNLAVKFYEDTIQRFGEQHGIEDELNKLETSLLAVLPFIRKADNMRIKDEEIKMSLDRLLVKLRDIAYDVENLLDEFDYQIQRQRVEQQGAEASNLSSSSFFFSLPPRKKAKTSISRLIPWFYNSYGNVKKLGALSKDKMEKVKKIQRMLDNIAAAFEKVITLLDADGRGNNQMVASIGQSTNCFPLTTIFGRDKELSKLESLLVKSGNAPGSSNSRISVFTIYGMVSIGKTTLAQEVYKRVAKHFQLRIWINVSGNSNMEMLTREIIEYATMEKCNETNIATLQRVLKQKLTSEKFLLVLDGLWSEYGDNWDESILEEKKRSWEEFCKSIEVGVPAGSTILITTSSGTMARMVGYDIYLDCLDYKSYWEFFKQCAFGYHKSEDHPQLEAIAKKIASKLNGLPLAARTVGEILNTKMDEKHWRTVMQGRTLCRYIRESRATPAPNMR